MAREIDEGEIALPPTRAGHIKKRALRNKALSISFNEKDLKDYVTGFHKRKKKRRKVAEKQQEEAYRRKRIELRKKRKLEKEFVMFGGPAPATDEAPKESDNDHEDDGESGPTASISGTTMYDNGDIRVTVRTSEISREDEDIPTEKLQAATEKLQAATSRPLEVVTKQSLAVSKKKPFKKASKRTSRPKTQNKREKRKKGRQNSKR